MAGKPRRRKRVRTAAQRAALKKAQAASARKRRRRRIKSNTAQGAKVVGSFIGAIGAYHATDIARHPSKGKKYYKSAKAGTANVKKSIRKYKHRNHGTAVVNLGVPKLPPRRGYNPRYL